MIWSFLSTKLRSTAGEFSFLVYHTVGLTEQKQRFFRETKKNITWKANNSLLEKLVYDIIWTMHKNIHCKYLTGFLQAKMFVFFPFLFFRIEFVQRKIRFALQNWDFLNHDQNRCKIHAWTEYMSYNSFPDWVHSGLLDWLTCKITIKLSLAKLFRRIPIFRAQTGKKNPR